MKPNDNDPPPFAGGQGRSAHSVRDDGTALALTILVALAVVAGLLLADWGAS